jgi:ATP-binding protein involved in chromosome partitioning
VSVITPAIVEAQLAKVIEPTSGRDLISLNCVKSIAIEGSKVRVSLLLGYPANSVSLALAQSINQALTELSTVEQVSVDLQYLPALRRIPSKPSLTSKILSRSHRVKVG